MAMNASVSAIQDMEKTLADTVRNLDTLSEKISTNFRPSADWNDNQAVNTVWITMMWSLHVVVHCRKQFIAVKPLWSRPRVRFSCRANRMILPVREFRSRRVSLLKAGGSNNGILLVSE